MATDSVTDPVTDLATDLAPGPMAEPTRAAPVGAAATLHHAPRRDPHADTWVTAAPDSRPHPVVPGEAVLSREEGPRYAPAVLLGSGGMGEVRLCTDAHIGREVAMKVIKADLADREDVHRRFVREARVQGQLEHPSIVPVYDLGIGEDGAAWFTMKRVRGRTLGEILEGLEREDQAIRGRWGRRRLLSAFSSLCLAVDFANARGVIHRDLKPGNVMLGDFGEVYLLDWGLAKLLGEADARGGGPHGADGDGDGGEGDVMARLPVGEATVHTQGDAIFGTPGYMSPEQVKGTALGPTADVYALGALLFEVLAGEPLHRGETSKEVLVSTLSGTDACPSRRAHARELPPELDAICERATRLDPATRYPTARALHDDLERYLDGDRDLALRRELATRHAREAEAAAERAGLAVDATAEQRERASALGEAGRALALDPASDQALGTMARLMMTPPSRLPPEAEEELERLAESRQRRAGREATFLYLSWLLFLPAVPLLGMRNGWQAMVSATLMAAAAAFSAAAARATSRRMLYLVASLCVSSVGIAAGSRSLGPFVVVPSLLIANTLCFLLTTDRRLRGVIVGVGLAAMLAPTVLEYAGLLPRSYLFQNNSLIVVPQMHDLPEAGIILFLVFAHIAILVNGALFVMGVRSSLVEAERRNHLYSWNLARFLPEHALHGLKPARAPAAVEQCILERPRPAPTGSTAPR